MKQVGERALVFLSLLSAAGAIAAQPFPAFFDATAFDGTIGFTLNGEDSFDQAGAAVAGPIDVNGDGFNDILVGASEAGGSLRGTSYVVFGRRNFPATIELSSLGDSGATIVGEDGSDQAGSTLGAGGDLDGNGRDDVLIGAPDASPDGTRSGTGYIVFGRLSLAGEIRLAELNGGTGFSFNGEGSAHEVGIGMDFAGDINGDGFGDLIIGAPGAGPAFQGEGYVIFGTTSVFSADLAASDLDGANGFTLRGETIDDETGASVSAAGDFNGDGLDDLMIGSPAARPNGIASGKAHLLFGRSEFPVVVALADLNSTQGLALHGGSAFDFAGSTVAPAGDFNSDGLDDLIVAGSSSGSAYVVFGRAEPNPGGEAIELDALDGVDGFAFMTDGDSISSAASIGDLNGDGRTDIAIGSTTVNGSRGNVFVIFGRSSVPAKIRPSDLDGALGFAIEGAFAVDNLGKSVASAGDVNGDGFDDLLMGASGVDTNGTSSGAAYLLYGRTATVPVAPLVAIKGRCPGVVSMSLSGFTPGGKVEVFSGRSLGTTEFAQGWCADSIVDLADATLRLTLSANAEGSVELEQEVPGSVCGGLLQFVDRASCLRTSVTAFPQGFVRRNGR